MSEAAASPKERLRWADTAKGTCILLVVLWHVHLLHYMELAWVTSVPVRGAWQAVHSVLTPVRMPLFFVISGMFAAAALRRPWKAVAVRRIASPYYLYVLWLLIHTAVYTVLQTDFSDLRVSSVTELVPRLLVPVNSLWYVYALALYFLVTKFLRRAPTWGVLAGAALLSAAVTAGWLPAPGLLTSVGRNFIFFLAGAYLPTLWRNVGARPGWVRLLPAGAAFAAVTTVYLTGLHRLFGLDVVAGFAAIWFGVIAAALVSRAGRISQLTGYLGRNTLQIYVLHGPLIGLVSWVAAGPGKPLWDPVLDNDLVAGLYPLLVGLVVVAASLLIHRLLLACRLDVLFNLTLATERRRQRDPAVQPLPSTGTS